MPVGDRLVHLHVHSEYSILDGCGKQEDYLERAKAMGQPAIAFTEHGTLRGIHKLHENATAMGGVKPLYGIEFYAAKKHDVKGLPPREVEKIREQYAGKAQRNKARRAREVELGLRKRYHVTALAKNAQGLKSLYMLSSAAWIDGFWWRPRIDLELLEKYGEGLVILSGCLDGYANQAYLGGDVEGALDQIEWYRERWGDDFYLEVMPNSLDEQKRVNAFVASVHRKWDIPLVATADVHYILKSDHEAHDVLLCVNTKKKLKDPDRWSFSVNDFWLQSRAEMEAMFAEHHPALTASEVAGAIDMTLEIAEKCDARLELDRFRALIPAPEVPEKYDSSEFGWLIGLCMDGWEGRDIPKRAGQVAKTRGVPFAEVEAEYAERLRYELTRIKAQKVDRYFLIIWDLYQWVRGRGIMCGPGRGSAGGSLVAYLIGITDVDPIEHGLIFERFLNPDRIDLPDIDCDFEDRRRPEIVEYLRDKYGTDRVAQISTVTRMTGKACLRDLSRVMDIPPGEIDAVVGSIVGRSSGDERESQTIEDAMTEFEVGRQFNQDHPDVLRFARRLEGQARGLGLHAAGVIVASDDLREWIPLETREHRGKRVRCTGVDMWGAEAQGLLKVDVLGLKALSVLADCLGAIEKKTGERIDLNWVDLNDPEVLANFTARRFVGVFQFDTTSAEKICEGVTFDSFEDIPAMVALDRPGTARSGLATQYLKRKADPSARKSIHPVIDRICSDTLGIIVYQEHVIKIFVEVAGFAPGTADSLRKLIAKKWGEEKLGNERKNFIEGAVGRGFDRKLATKLMDQITFFGSYGFNKSHATAYGLVSYWEMWLKTFHPLEFLWGLLANTTERPKVMKLVREARRLGIEVKPPDVNVSSNTFVISDGGVRSGLVELKGVGQAAAKAIGAQQPFDSFADFVARVDLRKCHKGAVMSLAKAGALESLIPNTRWFVEHLEEVWARRGKTNWPEWIEQQLEASRSEPDYDEDDRSLVAAEVSPLAFGKHPLEPHADFLDSLGVDWVTTAGDEIWEHKWAWVRGVVVEIRYNQVGDFHSGAEPEADQKTRMRWGARYANLNLEDPSGENKRVKVNHDTFDQYRHIVDKGNGTPLVALVSVAARWKSLKVKLAFDITKLRAKAASGEPWTRDEQALMEPGKLFAGHKRNDLVRKALRATPGAKVRGVAYVTSRDVKPDKNMNQMAWIGLYGRGGAVEALAFASTWPSVKDVLTPGALVEVAVTKSKDGGAYFIEAAKAAGDSP